MSPLHKRKKKWTIRWHKHRNIHLWGAGGLRHALFMAPLPRMQKTTQTAQPDRTLIERIVKSYKAIPPTHIAQCPVFFYHETFKKALDEADLDAVAAQLANLFRGTLSWSFGHHETYYFGEHRWKPGYQELRITDMLLSLGMSRSVLKS